ncbi:lipid-A-disaccharide synthase [Pseudoruegeria sp. HB172150]|uniref:lipid-A-disaccharide synthase n=1 Tax=Pseudoruegeria sp. HB172150 TaxID=2721164 RepID=UPI00155430FE|nr:lipid-A-disaccharide synthase [Pseudoruegeria sp. HB172150]
MRVFILAGEPSGDRLGAALMRGLKALRPEVQFDGIGGAEMQAEGLVSRFPMEELSVMGIAEVLPKIRHLKRRISQTADWVADTKPDVMITIDSPDFSLRVAAQVKASSDIRCVHYVAPSVWAWREGRAQKMARYIDQVLALLPFEPPYMEAAGVRCDFVGHPVVEDPLASPDEIAEFRAETGLSNAPILLVLPGSRRGEVSRLAPIFGEALRPVLAALPETRVVVPAAPGVASAVIDATHNWPGNTIVLDSRDSAGVDVARRKRAAFAAADAALAASGTVSLELAAAATPMVIAYDMNWLTWQIASRMLKIDTATLVNLVSETRAVPEYLGPACKPAPIADALIALLEDEQARAAQLAAMEKTMTALGKGDEPPGLRAARAVLDGLN